MWDPWEQFVDVDVDSVPAHLMPTPGLYFPERRTVAIAGGLTTSIERSVLAEELAHHDLGHHPTDDHAAAARMELRARRLAAQRLIALDELAEAIVGATYLDEVAEALDGDPELVRIRIRTLTDRARAALEWWARWRTEGIEGMAW